MTDRLPVEVGKRIVKHLHALYDNPTLASLACTCKAFQPIAEQHLYSTIYLPGIRSLQAILRTFASRPILATHPRQMYIRQPERDRTPQTYWNAVVDLLKCGGTNLEFLCFITFDPDAAYASWVLRSLYDSSGCLLTLLVPFWWDSELASFLESPGARGLKRLETGDVPGIDLDMQQIPGQISLRNDAVPYLTTVEAPPAALCLLVPGRPVSHIRFRVGSATSLQTLPPAMYLLGECLVRSTAPKGVIGLDVGDLTRGHRGETYSLEVLELAPRFLPNLKFIGSINFPWTKDIPITRLYKPLLRLPTLHVLELVVTYIHPPVDGYWELATCSEIRTFSPSLREIVFWKAFDRHRWAWYEEESDFVLVPPQESNLPWGGI